MKITNPKKEGGEKRFEFSFDLWNGSKEPTHFKTGFGTPEEIYDVVVKRLGELFPKYDLVDVRDHLRKILRVGKSSFDHTTFAQNGL